ncbi:F0F1 ATP synthase subunit gamma [Natronorarus salvus]|uniref:hypothetical protein n=1 Tax=Natronorarus salvus TaxID=3117733 RepID=UPI002F26CC25
MSSEDERDDRVRIDGIVEPSDDRLADRLDRLEAETMRFADRIRRRDDRIAVLEDRLSEHAALLDALRNRSSVTREMIAELQSRELEKHAHLRWESVEPNLSLLAVDGDSIEGFWNEDGNRYCRLPDGDDPLAGDSGRSLTEGDLLPIQRLSRMDDETLRSTAGSKPMRLAAEVWREREGTGLWKPGRNGVRLYLDAGELARWIRVREPSVDQSYSQKLAGRTIDELKVLSSGRLYDRLESRRKDGLRYKERRLYLPTDSEIPGEPSRREDTGEDTP